VTLAPLWLFAWFYFEVWSLFLQVLLLWLGKTKVSCHPPRNSLRFFKEQGRLVETLGFVIPLTVSFSNRIRRSHGLLLRDLSHLNQGWTYPLVETSSWPTTTNIQAQVYYSEQKHYSLLKLVCN
jgi:hypothetical protein